MVRLRSPHWIFGPVVLVSCTHVAALAQAQSNQPPANFRGPDTYGLCAYLIGDTEYYGRSFYTSSYFRSRAEQEIREYAQSQANGATVKAHCAWSYREADLETMKETDRRLVGLPGHPAKAVDVAWTFHGGTVGGAVAAPGATAGVGIATPGSGPTTGSNAGMSSNQNASAQRATRSRGTYGSTTSGLPDPGTSTSSSGSPTADARQSLSDAKSSAVSSASAGVTTATNTAMGALNTGMQNMFRRRQAKTEQDSSVAQSTAAGGQAAGLTAPTQSAGFGFGDPAPPNAAASASPVASVEGVVADVAGNDLIVNVGSQAGLRAGSTLLVMHPQRTVNDPVTGKPLRVVEAQLGELRITSVEPGSASGVFSGAGVPVVGDKVRAKP